jgi:hypothetical protein
MLVRLFGSNFRSLKKEFELSLVAADLTREKDIDRGVIEVPIGTVLPPLRLLRTVAIFGSNASGKSTVLTATRALRWLVMASSMQSQPDASIPPYEPFLLDSQTLNVPVKLGCDVVGEKSLIRYEIEYGKKQIERELLTIISGTEEVKLIDRLRSGEVTGKLIARSKANRLYVKEMQPNVAVLSKLAHHGPHKGPESVQPYFRALRNALIYQDYSDSATIQIKLGELGDERFADDSEYREWIMLNLIQAADLGISDVTTRRESFEFPDIIKNQLEQTNNKELLSHLYMRVL